MLLNKTQKVPSAMAFLDCVDSFEPEMGLLRFVGYSKRPPTIIDHKLAILVMEEGEQMPCYVR